MYWIVAILIKHYCVTIEDSINILFIKINQLYQRGFDCFIIDLGSKTIWLFKRERYVFVERECNWFDKNIIWKIMGDIAICLRISLHFGDGMCKVLLSMYKIGSTTPYFVAVIKQKHYFHFIVGTLIWKYRIWFVKPYTQYWKIKK